MSIQDALSTIMDLCETSMKENDYLIVTNQLKLIYDENKKNISKKKRRIIKANRILNDELLHEHSDATFELTDEEKKSVMNNRLKMHYKDVLESITEEIGNVVELIEEVIIEKKDAFAFTKQLRYSYSPNRENAIYEHKQLVQREKELKLRLKALRSELAMVRGLV
jgi:hypothetical protein